MAAPEKKSIASIIKEIEDAAKDKGTITDQEFFEITGDSAIEGEMIDKIYEALEELSIKVIETSSEGSLDDVFESDPDEMSEGDSYSVIDDPVKVYLKEIGKVQLLTNEQEIELAERIKNGDDEAKKEIIRGKPQTCCKYRKTLSGQRYAFS